MSNWTAWIVFTFACYKCYSNYQCSNSRAPFCRVITRVALLPFVDNRGNSTLSPSERDMADFELNEAMKKASKGAGLIVRLGNVRVITIIKHQSFYIFLYIYTEAC